VRRLFCLMITLVLLWAEAHAQSNTVVFMDARYPLQVGPFLEGPPGYFSSGPYGFLVQGGRNEFVLVNRRFLTEYTISIDGVTTLQNFPIEDLNEAASLTTALQAATSAVSKGAAPKGLSTSGNLSQRTAQQILSELLSPDTSAGPLTELNSDWLTLSHEAQRVEADKATVLAMFGTLLGPGLGPVFPAPVPAPQGAPVPPFAEPGPLTNNVHTMCNPSLGAPTLHGVELCLSSILSLEYSTTFPPAPPAIVPLPAPFPPPPPFIVSPPVSGYSDEPAFRDLIVTDNDAILMVQNLGNALATQVPATSTALSTLDGDTAQYLADLNVFVGNLQALNDSLVLLQNLQPYTQLTQIRAHLQSLLNPTGTTAVDPTELNALARQYQQAGGGITAAAIDRLSPEFAVFADGIYHLPSIPVAAPVPPAAGAPRTTFFAYMRGLEVVLRGVHGTDLVEDEHTFNVVVPDYIRSVNILQSQVLSRTNEIYDRSDVPVPVRKQLDISGNSGNLLVYYTVRKIETFPRFAVPPLTEQGQAAAASLPAAAAPPTPAASTTAAASTASTSSTSSSPASTPGADTSSGVIVAHGVVQVHDRYKATMVAMFGFSGIGTQTFTNTTVSSGTASDGSTACNSTNPCTQISVTPGAAHSAVLVGFSFHPYGYDTYPHFHQSFKHSWGIMGGLSVLSFNDYYAGPDLQIAHGIQVALGVNVYQQGKLNPIYMNNGIYPGTPTFTVQHWTTGVFGGIGLNLSIFRKAFGSVTGVGTSTKSTGS
jgi:hypothetical protein